MPHLLRVGGGDLAGGARAGGEVGVVRVAEERHRRPRLVVVDRRAGLGRDVVGVGDVGEHVVEGGDELVVDLLAPAKGLRRRRRVGAGKDVVQRRAILRTAPPFFHGDTRVPYSTDK